MLDFSTKSTDSCNQHPDKAQNFISVSEAPSVWAPRITTIITSTQIIFVYF